MTFTLIRNGTLIEGNTIRQVGPSATIRLPDADISTLDALGGFILPGFIDSHVHITYDGTTGVGP